MFNSCVGDCEQEQSPHLQIFLSALFVRIGFFWAQVCWHHWRGGVGAPGPPSPESVQLLLPSCGYFSKALVKVFEGSATLEAAGQDAERRWPSRPE